MQDTFMRDIESFIQRFIDELGSFEFHHMHKIVSLMYKTGLRSLPVDLSRGLVFTLEDNSYEYEVYVAEDIQQNVLYVGEGKRGRHEHLHSGRSSCVHANEWVAHNKPFNIIVHGVADKKLAQRFEAQLIKELDPTWNTKGKR